MEKSQGEKYKISRGCIYNLNYHLVWTPKRRSKVLVGNVEIDIKVIFKKLAEDLNIQIISMEIMPDHVHLFVSSHPVLSPHQIVKKFKGASSNFLRKKYPQLLKLPALWSSSYYCGTVGFASESVVKSYIENQKGK